MKWQGLPVFIIVISLILLIIFIVSNYQVQEKKTVAVNLQVTEYKNPEALLAVISELELRGLKPATIFVSKELTLNNCSVIRELDSKGYEIAVYGYALNDAGAFIQIATFNKTEQYRIINETKTVIEECLGHEVKGFRSQRFSKNNETNEIVNDLGFAWHGSFVTGWDNDSSVIPYYSNKYGFYVVSIENVPGTGAVLCDTALSSNNKTAIEWRETIKYHFMIHQESGAPFITEFHPYFLYNNTGWWNEFISLINFLENQKNSYLTTTQFINYTCNNYDTNPFVTNQPDLVCGE